MPDIALTLPAQHGAPLRESAFPEAKAAIDADDPQAFKAASSAPGFDIDSSVVAQIQNYASGTKWSPDIHFDDCNSLKYAVDRRAFKVAEAILSDPLIDPNPCIPDYGWPSCSMAAANGDIDLAELILEHPNFDIGHPASLNSMRRASLTNGRRAEGCAPSKELVERHARYARRYVELLGPFGSSIHASTLVSCAAEGPEHHSAIVEGLASFGATLVGCLRTDAAKLQLVEECWDRDGRGLHLADSIPTEFYSLLVKSLDGDPSDRRDLLGFFMSEKIPLPAFERFVSDAPEFVRRSYARNPSFFSYIGAEHLRALEAIGVSPFDEPEPRTDRRPCPAGVEFVVFRDEPAAPGREASARAFLLDERLPELIAYAESHGLDLNAYPDIHERALLAATAPSERRNGLRI